MSQNFGFWILYRKEKLELAKIDSLNKTKQEYYGMKNFHTAFLHNIYVTFNMCQYYLMFQECQMLIYYCLLVGYEKTNVHSESHKIYL